MKLHLKNNVYPLPTEAEIAEVESDLELRLPDDYREFIKKYGACEIEECVFDEPYEGMVLESLIGIIPNYTYSPQGYYDIEVMMSLIDERLADIPEYAGLEPDELADVDDSDVDERESLIPIGSLFAGNLICLDYRKDRNNPTVCYWDHEQSKEFAPYTEPVAKSFTEFLHMLYGMDADGPEGDMNEPLEIIVPQELTWRQKIDIKFGKLESAMQIAHNLHEKGISDESIYGSLCKNEEVLFHGPRVYKEGVKLEAGKYYKQGNIEAKCIKSSDGPMYAPLKELDGIYVRVLGNK